MSVPPPKASLLSTLTAARMRPCGPAPQPTRTGGACLDVTTPRPDALLNTLQWLLSTTRTEVKHLMMATPGVLPGLEAPVLNSPMPRHTLLLPAGLLSGLILSDR